MFENKNIKLFFMGLLCLLIASKARSKSVYQMKDVRIEISDDKWICDKIECPPQQTDRCFVSKHQDSKDRSIVLRTNICYSKDNVVLKESHTTEVINPNSKIDMDVNSYRSGTVSNVNSYGNSEDFDEKKFKEDLEADLQKMRENMAIEMENMNKNLQNQMANMHHNLQNMNQNMNEDLENQMREMEYNLENMFN